MENITTPQTSDLNQLLTKYSSFISEIRKRIIFTLIVFVLGVVTGFLFYENIIKLLIDILSLKGVNIVFTSPFQFINLAISCGIATGLVMVFPLLIYQILSFLKPALKKSEFKLIMIFLPFSIVLFLIGFSFGMLIMRWQIQVFLTQSVTLGIGNILDISKLMSTVLFISSVMGVAFQVPIIILILARIGIIKHSQLTKKRLWIYLGAFIFTIFLPLDSILADLLLALPLVVLFEITLLINGFFERRKKAGDT